MHKLNETAATVHAANRKWWISIEDGSPIKRNRGELLMLVITEIAEACEGLRKNLKDDKLPHRMMVEVEMADALIRLLDYAGGFNEQLYETSTIDLPDNQAEAMLYLCFMVCQIDTTGKPCGMAISTVIAGIESFCVKFGYDLMGAYEEKMAYNATRKDHTSEARKLANGKKF